MAKKREQPSKRRRTTVQHEELAPGTVLTARVKGRELSASVVTGPEGTPEVEFEGTRYPSLSAAGKAAGHAAQNRRRSIPAPAPLGES